MVLQISVNLGVAQSGFRKMVRKTFEEIKHGLSDVLQAAPYK